MQLAFDLDLPVEAATVKRARGAAGAVRQGRAKQLTLPGLPPAPIAPLFLAVCPDAHASEEIDRRIVPAITNAIAGDIDVVPWECRHISLLGFGRFDHVAPALIDKLDAMLRRLNAPAFPAGFDRLMTFGARGAVVLTGLEVIGPLRDFQGRICEALQLPPHFRNFTPHMTIAYAQRTVPQREIGPVSWQVRELRLIHSLRNPYRHVIKARWPLAA
jgi:2'-5' RNA ligase